MSNFAHQKKLLIKTLQYKGIDNPDVLDAILEIPREEFLPEALQDVAYEDTALPIAEDQTISQPFIVAFMTQVILTTKPKTVLEIGTGSGYQTAILAKLIPKVYTVERIKTLQSDAQIVLKKIGIQNVTFAYGDGRLGLKKYAPFDAIIVTACSQEIYPAWREQLADNGSIVVPVMSGDGFHQMLCQVKKHHGQFTEETFFPVRFVPLQSGKI